MLKKINDVPPFNVIKYPMFTIPIGSYYLVGLFNWLVEMQ